MERSLAHIEQITELYPIAGADKIEVARILGWECVVKKGEFSIGEKVIYVEVDSVMPDTKEFEFLRERKFRIRTIKLRGQISQGLVLSLKSLPVEYSFKQDWKLGEDVTEIMKITKYLTPSEQEEASQLEFKLRNDKNKLRKFLMRYAWFRNLVLSRKSSGFPSWVSKTDEVRGQNLRWNEFYEQYKDTIVYVTEKVDYQSATFTGKLNSKFSGPLGKLIPIKKYQFIVCGRNTATNDKSTLYWKIAGQYNIEQILKENPTLTIQGEQGSTKVQGNKYGITEPTLWVFNIIDHEKKYQYNWDEMVEFCNKYNLTPVPLVKICKLSDIGTTIQDFIEFSKGNSIITPTIKREGVVIRCIENGNKIFSFKVINPEFLLEYEN